MKERIAGGVASVDDMGIFCKGKRGLMMQVTIIIPIHNSEKYLKECIESALCQRFQELEILCIDGGSTDGSADIVHELQRKDGRIQLLYDSNTSYGHKINIGIERASGKYISILESDDRMEPDMIGTLYHIAKRYDADIADGDYFDFADYKGKKLITPVCKYTDPLVYGRLITHEKEINRNIATHGIWTGLYKKAFLLEQRIRLNESPGASYQDVSFLFLTSFLAKKVYHVNIPLYQYRVDNDGSSVKDGRKIFEIVEECEFLKKELLNRKVKEEAKWDLYHIRKYQAFYWNYCRLQKEAKELFLKKYVEELNRDINSGAIDRKTFDTSLYDRMFLIFDDKERFVKKAGQVGQPFFAKVCKYLEKISGRDVVLFGAGAMGVRLLYILTQNKNHVRGICDNSTERQKDVLEGFKIRSVEQAVHEFPDAVYFITSCRYKDEMKAQLLTEGIREECMVVFE